MNNAAFDAFAAQHPNCARLTANLSRMEAAVSSGCFASFFEPVALLDYLRAESSPKLLGPLAPYLEAWTSHIAYGTIARLRGLTGPAVRLLVDQRLSIASILERTILEHAGRAAFAVCRLTDCSRNDKWDDLRVLIPKTLFGTSMMDVEGTLFEDQADSSGQRPIKPADFIKALEQFAGTEESSGKSFFNGTYALLCELTHASQRANQSFCRVLETNSGGWQLEYAWDEECPPDAIEGALKSTARCLQAGYAASVMLLAWRFGESADRVFGTAPSETEMQWIWQNLLDPALVFD